MTAVVVDLDGVRQALLRRNGPPIHTLDNAFYLAPDKLVDETERLGLRLRRLNRKQVKSGVEQIYAVLQHAIRSIAGTETSVNRPPPDLMLQ